MTTGQLDTIVDCTKSERPPKPARARKPERAPTLLTPARHLVKRGILRAIDRGWFGLVPLQWHMVMCGFPRSGTTLLQLMLETAYPQARSFRSERSGLGAAQNDWPGRHPFIISKQPNDIFWIDEIREYYRWCRTRTHVHFVVCVRDPRAVLTSVHEIDPNAYWVSVERWRAVYEHFQYARTYEDVTTVEYRDLIERPAEVQHRLMTITGTPPSRAFEQFQDGVPAEFDTRALNGVRPLDPAAIHKWKSPRHRQRICELLRDMPELPTRLIEMGYEPDDSWIREYVQR